MFSFIVSEETCPKCGHETDKQDAIHFQVNGQKTWTYASANAPFGAVTEDEMDENDPSEEDCPDLILDTNDVTVTCTKCGEPLAFTSEQEQG
jgi:predicted RNA-binding Zn-ribbon protein involved in translation (DUF1610 family)